MATELAEPKSVKKIMDERGGPRAFAQQCLGKFVEQKCRDPLEQPRGWGDPRANPLRDVQESVRRMDPLEETRIARTARLVGRDIETRYIAPDVIGLWENYKRMPIEPLRTENIVKEFFEVELRREDVLGRSEKAIFELVARALARVVIRMTIESMFMPTGALNLRVETIAPTKREQIPEGWPPNEPWADVIDENGVRQAGRAGKPLRGGTPLTAAQKQEMLMHGHGGWQCCTCGTHNPADPCIPGAYF